MKILVATGETQGHRTNDFCWAEEGEIVTFGSECADESVDGPCGCRRALRGVRTRKATTTFRVVERSEVSPGDLTRMVGEALVAGGWYRDLEQARAAAAEDALQVAAIALDYAEGTVLERRDESFVARELRAAKESRAVSERRLEEAQRILLEEARRVWMGEVQRVLAALPDVSRAVDAVSGGE
jgi:hypothetical protein